MTKGLCRYQGAVTDGHDQPAPATMSCMLQACVAALFGWRSVHPAVLRHKVLQGCDIQHSAARQTSLFRAKPSSNTHHDQTHQEHAGAPPTLPQRQARREIDFARLAVSTTRHQISDNAIHILLALPCLKKLTHYLRITGFGKR